MMLKEGDRQLCTERTMRAAFARRSRGSVRSGEFRTASLTGRGPRDSRSVSRRGMRLMQVFFGTRENGGNPRFRR